MKRFFPFLFLFFMPLMAFANSTSGLPNIGDMFASFSSSVKPIITLVGGIAFLLGLVISGKAALTLKDFAESGGRTKLSTPITLFLVGICLITFPGTINVISHTFSLGDAATDIFSQAPSDSGGIPGMSAALNGIMLFIALIGNIAVVRGFLILKRGAEGDQSAGFGKALVHIIGGVFAINMHVVATILSHSLGIVLPM